MATRQQQMKKINEKRKEESYRKIVGLISGLTSFEYKSKNGSWNISKIAKDLKITRPTVYKYIQEYEKKFWYFFKKYIEKNKFFFVVSKVEN